MIYHDSYSRGFRPSWQASVIEQSNHIFRKQRKAELAAFLPHVQGWSCLLPQYSLEKPSGTQPEVCPLIHASVSISHELNSHENMRKAVQEERGAQIGCVPHARTQLVCSVPSQYPSRQQSGQALIWGLLFCVRFSSTIC